MVRHFIILSSSYTKGQRIALDLVDTCSSAVACLQALERIKRECGEDTSISMHCIETETAEWSSVVYEDSFFEDVLVAKDIDEFIKVIQTDRSLNGLDVAKYILSKISCTHLKLQKLVYYCYADYLCMIGKSLFQDQIYAFELGPVIKSVRDTFKGYRYIDGNEMDIIGQKSSLQMPIRSRILFADQGIEKLNSIDRTINKYGNLEASELVDLTHRRGTPWDVSYDGTLFKIIPDEVIRRNHFLEELR